MPRMTLEQFADYQKRGIAEEAENQPHVKRATARVRHESNLHFDILKECKLRGWLVFHGSMAHRTYRTPGEPDFMILADRGRLLMIECKTKDGKLSQDQQGIKAWAEKLGHAVHVVRSKQQFLEII